jgi:hypothetical protein
MTAPETSPAGCSLIGRWRILEADLSDREYLDLCGPAFLAIGADGHGEIAFGALQAGLDLEYSQEIVFFSFEGCDEMDEVRGTGTTEHLDDASIEIEFSFDHGDEAVLKAVRDTSSTAC